MPLLHNNPTLLQAGRLSISLFHGSLFLPPILFAFICISFTFFLILPTLVVLATSFLCLKVAFQFSIALLEIVFVRFCSWPLGGKDMSNRPIRVKMVEGVEEKQVSVELDPSELPSLYESEEEEEEEGEAGNHGSCKSLDSYEIEVLKYVDNKEHKPFYELLTYWRSKEREEGFGRVEARCGSI